MAKTNHSGSAKVDPVLADLFRRAHLTEPELAKFAGLHINTVKKILRGDHVHPNSVTKLERALQDAIMGRTGEVATSTVRPLRSAGSDTSIVARKRTLLAQAESFAREAADLVIELAKAGETIGPEELARLRTCLSLASNAVSMLDGVATK